MEKNHDRRGRWRNRIVAFRVSDEEAKIINAQVKLSGHTKQDFIIKRLQNKEVVVQGNPKVFKALKEELGEVLTELRRIATGSTVDPDMMETIHLITVTLEGMKRDDEWI